MLINNSIKTKQNNIILPNSSFPTHPTKVTTPFSGMIHYSKKKIIFFKINVIKKEISTKRRERRKEIK